MHFTAQQIPYRDTATFSKIVIDYLDNAEALQPFYSHPPTAAGIKKAVAEKQKQAIDRAALVQVLQAQYQMVNPGDAVLKNINALLSSDTFTICTAHQPNLFTGPLYFVYKILHAIRLAQYCQQQYPQYQFVPVYYMGSEDADKEELNHTYLNGKKYEWQTGQTGAVGRMIVDAKITGLINEMAGQLNVLPFGPEIIEQLRHCYKVGTTIQQATFAFVHGLFKNYGLIVLIADHADLKKFMIPVFEDDLFQQTPSAIVENTCGHLGETYNVQATPRAINLFYLKEGVRNRIVKQEELFLVNDTDIRFTAEALKTELQKYPERFSPNVILRGLFQETILPNIAFIGGGGELAYWLQLKDLFSHYHVPFPVLVLRNSFLIIEKKWQDRMCKWNVSAESLFKPVLQIINHILASQDKLPLLNGEVAQLQTLYGDLKKLAAGVDVTLEKHVDALKTKAIQQLYTLEKKMTRAERKKHNALQHQVTQLKETLFPGNGLQERVENMSSFYARWGSGFIDVLLKHSLALEQHFMVLAEK